MHATYGSDADAAFSVCRSAQFGTDHEHARVACSEALDGALHAHAVWRIEHERNLGTAAPDEAPARYAMRWTEKPMLAALRANGPSKVHTSPRHGLGHSQVRGRRRRSDDSRRSRSRARAPCTAGEA